jgi:hypothetical protein
MARFFGKNNDPVTKNLISERVKFKINAYQKELDGLDQKPIVDYNFAERVLYGRIDQNLSSVIPKPEFMVSLANTNNPESAVQLLDFVADMYQDLVNSFEKACRLQILNNNDPYLSKINAYRTYEEPNFDYSIYISDVLNEYNQEFIIKGNREDEIFNLSQYINNLFLFSKSRGSEVPITFTGFLLSVQTSLFTSGLAISISNLPFGEDAQKDDFFIQNEAFQYYLNLAKNIGFSVAKNSPWVLVADLASPAIKPYLQKYGMTNVNDVFQTRYTQTHLSDIDKLIRPIVTSYRNFVNQKPFYKQIKACGPKTQSEIIYRERINNDSSIQLRNNNILLIQSYCKIRNIEENNPLNNIELNKLIRESINYEKSFDMLTAVGYINDKFKDTRKFKDGGINSIIRKQQEKKSLTNDASKDTMLGSLFNRGY